MLLILTKYDCPKKKKNFKLNLNLQNPNIYSQQFIDLIKYQN